MLVISTSLIPAPTASPFGAPLLLCLFPGLAPWVFLSRALGASFAPETSLGLVYLSFIIGHLSLVIPGSGWARKPRNSSYTLETCRVCRTGSRAVKPGRDLPSTSHAAASGARTHPSPLSPGPGSDVSRLKVILRQSSLRQSRGKFRPRTQAYGSLGLSFRPQ